VGDDYIIRRSTPTSGSPIQSLTPMSGRPRTWRFGTGPRPSSQAMAPLSNGSSATTPAAVEPKSSRLSSPSSPSPTPSPVPIDPRPTNGGALEPDPAQPAGLLSNVSLRGSDNRGRSNDDDGAQSQQRQPTLDPQAFVTFIPPEPPARQGSGEDRRPTSTTSGNPVCRPSGPRKNHSKRELPMKKR
jgi:hypothetical protein